MVERPLSKPERIVEAPSKKIRSFVAVLPPSFTFMQPAPPPPSVMYDAVPNGAPLAVNVLWTKPSSGGIFRDHFGQQMILTFLTSHRFRLQLLMEQRALAPRELSGQYAEAYDMQGALATTLSVNDSPSLCTRITLIPRSGGTEFVIHDNYGGQGIAAILLQGDLFGVSTDVRAGFVI